MTEPVPALLPEGSLTADIARDAVRAAGSSVGLAVDPVELIRVGSNAVLRLPRDVVGRVASGAEALDNGRQQVRASTWLTEQGLSAVRAIEVAQPAVAHGCVVTFWHSVSDTVEYGSLHDLAVLIRQLHGLPEPDFALPVFDLRRHLDDRLATLRRAIVQADFIGFERQLDRLLAQFSRFEFADVGPIHGDANIGNVIIGSDGSRVLMDLDNVARGPREWDLIKTAVYYERFDWHTDEEYGDFCEVLGRDITEWSGYRTAAALVEMLMTLWLSRRAEHDADAHAETRKRVRAILNDLPRTDWLPY